MIEFAQSAAPWIGIAVMLLAAVAALALVVLLVIGLAWKTIKQCIGLTTVIQALREWHRRHPS